MSRTRQVQAMEYVRYCLFDYWHEVGDARTQDYVLMSGGPLPMLGIVCTYVLLVKWLGPRLMEHRASYGCTRLMIVYNIYNIVVNVWFFYESLTCLDYGRLLFVFEYPSRHDWSLKTLHCCKMLYLFMLSKLVDMLDTVFFVLRKKMKQVSVLHVYHHSIVPIIIWMAVKLMPTGGPAGLFPLLNSAIHAMMYTYYTLSALGPSFRPYIFWKKYLTIAQLAQFAAYMVHGTLFLFVQQGYPKFIVYLAYIQNPLFFMMFYTFFQNTYANKRQV